MGSIDPKQCFKWLREVGKQGEAEEILGKADPNQDEGYVLENGNHDSESEQEIEQNNENEDNNDSVPYYVGKDEKTKWRKTCPKKTTKVQTFEKKPRPINDAANAKTALECMECFLSRDIVENITNFTNVYINHIKSNYQRKRDAKPTDTCEIRSLIGILYLIGCYKSGRQNIKDFWNTNGTGIEAICCTMSYDRFRFLLRCLRFDDANDREQRREIDKLAAIRDVFQTFVGNCQKAVVPGTYLTIDEQLIPFRGRCSFKQYIPSKPAKYGIKIFALVDSSNMYTLNLEIYAGSQPEGPFRISNRPIEVVKRLVDVVKGTHRNITMDNWFSSFPLAMELKKEFRLTMLGTLKKNMKEVPKEFVNTIRRPEKSSQFAFHKDCTLVSFVPKKKRNVLILSTMHDDDSIDDEIGKPKMVVDYNNTKFGVDVVDQMCAAYSVARNSRRWPLTVFFDIMNITGINALILYKLNNTNNKKIVRREFLQSIALELMKVQIKRRLCMQNIPKRLKEKCRLLLDMEESSTSIEENGPSKPKKAKTGNGRCYICPRIKDKRTRNFCEFCDKWICKDHQKKFPLLCVYCEKDININ